MRELPCPGCSYNLADLSPGRCPECGRTFTRRELWRTAELDAWRWVWLDGSLRLTCWLWVAMLFGLGVLRLFDGYGLYGWLVPVAIATVGLSTGILQRSFVKRRSLDANGAAPSRALSWSVSIQFWLVILIGLPVAGMALMLVILGIYGMFIG